jgi:uncharacterized protein (TIGR00369 family)
MPVTLTPDYFNQLGRENLPGHLKIVVTEVAEGLLKAEFAVGPHLLAPNGFMHGGSVVALADTCAGYGAIANLPEGATTFTTVELKTNYLGTAREGVSSVPRPRRTWGGPLKFGMPPCAPRAATARLPCSAARSWCSTRKNSATRRLLGVDGHALRRAPSQPSASWTKSESDGLRRRRL